MDYKASRQFLEIVKTKLLVKDVTLEIVKVEIGSPGEDCYEVKVTPRMQAHELEDLIDKLTEDEEAAYSISVCGGYDSDKSILTGEHLISVWEY